MNGMELLTDFMLSDVHGNFEENKKRLVVVLSSVGGAVVGNYGVNLSKYRSKPFICLNMFKRRNDTYRKSSRI